MKSSSSPMVEILRAHLSADPLAMINLILRIVIVIVQLLVWFNATAFRLTSYKGQLSLLNGDELLNLADFVPFDASQYRQSQNLDEEYAPQVFISSFTFSCKIKENWEVF